MFTFETKARTVSHVYEGCDVFVWRYCAVKFLPFVFNHKYSRTDSLVVVVSQLVSLMVDQVDGLRQKGVKAAIISPVGRRQNYYIRHINNYHLTTSSQLNSHE